jgi:hypothetical protein
MISLFFRRKALSQGHTDEVIITMYHGFGDADDRIELVYSDRLLKYSKKEVKIFIQAFRGGKKKCCSKIFQKYSKTI